MTVSPRRCRFIAVIALAAAGCARGADQARLQNDVQQRLDENVKQGLFEIVGMRRQGSAPLAAGANGAERVVVYYNATLRLTSDYQFGGWDQLGGASLAYALGATEKGLFGLTPDNHAGDLVRAYGSAIYQRTGDVWLLQPAPPAQAIAAANIDGSAPPSHSKLLIDRLAAMVDLPPPGVPVRQDRIIAEELETASENIERRFKRREHTFTIAIGPAGGEYARFGMSLIGAVNGLAPHLKLRARASAGSVDNAWLLSRGEADYAIVQGDVAAAAFGGREPFDHGGSLGMLRAVGGLFPEAVHVIVSVDGPIRDVSQLRGQRVAVGDPASGSRFDAVAVLAAHDLQLRDLHEIADLPLDEALARLKEKRTDAVFVTAAVPLRALQQFALDPGFRLLSLHPDEVDHVAQLRSGLTRITLPPNTYPQQRDPITTVAALALLVTTTDAPAADVQHVSELLSTRLVRPPTTGKVIQASATGASDALSIPLHPGLAGRRR